MRFCRLVFVGLALGCLAACPGPANDASDNGPTDTPAIVRGPSRVVAGVAGGHRKSPNFNMDVSVGAPVTVHRLTSPRYRLELGAGANLANHLPGQEPAP